ncbi:hypothetical protein PE066_08735 [Ramlibacter tataouinensis]|uniref:hypothetical protein n=1 Tax=Ramlibacter tataouinensis TaxID=94132 RepID=UPI0022F38225|nr:hypothetical protein [Ramlibacter tataouinensis]WBY03600.1 hypothetical protein PE066_08735 [Ramlibacter tataouinensis]
MATRIASADLQELTALIARGRWIRYDSFIAPAVLRGRFDVLHFYCLQDDDDDAGIDAAVLAAGQAQQVLHQSAQSLAGLQPAHPLIFDLCLDLFNRADGYFESDLWSDEEVNAFLQTCRPLIESACLVTISLSFGCSGSRADTRRLAELVVPQIVDWRA